LRASRFLLSTIAEVNPSQASCQISAAMHNDTPLAQ
jgi:hypothetical protein